MTRLHLGEEFRGIAAQRALDRLQSLGAEAVDHPVRIEPAARHATRSHVLRDPQHGIGGRHIEARQSAWSHELGRTIRPLGLRRQPIEMGPLVVGRIESGILDAVNRVQQLLGLLAQLPAVRPVGAMLAMLVQGLEAFPRGIEPHRVGETQAGTARDDDRFDLILDLERLGSLRLRLSLARATDGEGKRQRDHTPPHARSELPPGLHRGSARRDGIGREHRPGQCQRRSNRAAQALAFPFRPACRSRSLRTRGTSPFEGVITEELDSSKRSRVGGAHPAGERASRVGS
jgi:hypothetical protein